MIEKLNIACISDVHLGHHRTKTPFILDNLRKAFPDNAETASIDLFLIAGDFFDRLLSFSSDEVQEIQFWIMEFFCLCIKHDIVVRVLEGTPSHDWKQSKIFRTVNRIMGEKVDLKYVDVLSIEVIERFNASILYVPDEWAHEADDTWRQVKELLKAHGMDKVDLACMHGMFEYQLPMKSNKAHNAERYLGIVRYYIFIGHVHLRSRLDRILVQGSFDRDTHGQEQPKGYYRVTIDQKKGDEVRFVENPHAKLYLTLDMRGKTLREGMDFLTRYADYPAQSHFRLLLERGDELVQGLTVIRELYPQFIWTSQLDDLESPESADLPDQTAVPKPMAITPDNVVTLTAERIKADVPDPVRKLALTLLQNLL